MRTIIFLFFAFFSTSNASVILLNSGDVSSYRVLNPTEHGDVALSTCPMIANPVPDCEAEGRSTMVITRSVFEAKLKLAGDHDQYTANEKEKIGNLRMDIKAYKKALQETETKLANAQMRASNLEEKISILANQIKDVETKLQDPNLDDEDRRELEGFLNKAKADKAALEKDLAKVKIEVSGLEGTKKQQADRIAYDEKAITDAQTRIQSRKTLLDTKAMDLMVNLDQKQLTTAYENESLYFVATFLFDPGSRAIDDAGCTVEAAFNGSFNNVHAIVKLTEGVFPKYVKLGQTKIELYDGANLDLVMSSLGVKGWNKGDLFEYKSPRTNSRVVCDDSNGITGAKEVSWVKTYPGSLNNDTQCNGKPSRRYVTIAMYYVGRMNSKSTAVVCAGLNPLDGYDITTAPLNQYFYQGNYFEGVHIQNLFKESPVLASLKVEGHQYLKDGYYTLASATKPYLWEFTAEKTKITDFTGTDHEKTVFDWELPAMCYLRVNRDYCD